MQYISTRQTHEQAVSASEAFLNGLPDDGGLWVPEAFPRIDADTLRRMAAWPLSRRYAHILHLFLDEIPVNDLERICVGLIPDSSMLPRWTSHSSDDDDSKLKDGSYYSPYGVKQLNPYNQQLYLLDLTSGPTATAEDLVVGLIPRVMGYLRERAGREEDFRFLTARTPDQVTAAAVAFASACEEGFLRVNDSFTAVYAADLAGDGRTGVVDREKLEQSLKPRPIDPVDQVSDHHQELSEEEHEALINQIIEMLDSDDAAGVRLVPDSDEQKRRFEEVSVPASSTLLLRPGLPHSIAERVASEQMRFLPVGGFADQVQQATDALSRSTEDRPASYLPLDERHPLSMLLPVAHLISCYCDLLADERINEEELLTFIVPSSHLSLYLAVAYAAQMGLPLRMVYASMAQNSAIAEFFRSGRMSIKGNGFHDLPSELDLDLGDEMARGERRRVSAGEARPRRSGGAPRQSGQQGGGQGGGGGKRRSNRQQDRRRRRRGGGEQEGGGQQEHAQQGQSRRRKRSGKRGAPAPRSTAALTPNFEALIPTNLERLLFELTGRQSEQIRAWASELQEHSEFRIDRQLLKQLQTIFQAGYADAREIQDSIRESYAAFDLPLDPHSATAYAVYQRQNLQKDNGTVVFLQTHDPLLSAKPMIETLFGRKQLRHLDLDQAVQELAEEFGLNLPAIALGDSLPAEPAIPLAELPEYLAQEEVAEG